MVNLDLGGRVLEITGESREVRAVMGCHTEMSRTSGRDYPAGTTYQPDEPPLQMSVNRLPAVRDAARWVGGSPGAYVLCDFAIVNEPD